MENKSNQERECPECGGETVWDESAKETVCLECGYVLEEIESNSEQSGTSSSDEEWTAFESTEECQDSNEAGTTPPETADEWEMWYPCPVCHSTELNQIIESHLTVSAAKDGSYDGESSVEEYNYVECNNCEEVLLDEIGKSS